MHSINNVSKIIPPTHFIDQDIDDALVMDFFLSWMGSSGKTRFRFDNRINTILQHALIFMSYHSN